MLKNGKRERFAQGIAAGKSMQQAYIDAGYSKNTGNPTTLKRKKDVALRIEELLTNSAMNAEVTKASLLAELELARRQAMDKNQTGAAVAATIGKARITGNIIDRREVGDAGAFDAFTDDELVAAAAKKARELGIGGPRSIDPVVEEVLEAGADDPVDNDGA